MATSKQSILHRARPPLRTPDDASGKKTKSKGISGLVKRPAVEAAHLAKDFTKLPQAIEPVEQFFFLRSDAHPVHGLQNWSHNTWCEYLIRQQLEEQAKSN